MNSLDLQDVIAYEPLTGVLRWKSRPISHFKNLRSCNTWNATYAGKQAGTLDRHGYIAINFQGKLNRAHRIAWYLMTGEWPKSFMDHKNGIRNDNRWDNLRQATRAQNNCNKSIRSNNTSGALGISRHPDNGRWRAQICIGGKRRHLGYFITLQEAQEARSQAEMEEHGEFAASRRTA